MALEAIPEAPQQSVPPAAAANAKKLFPPRPPTPPADVLEKRSRKAQHALNLATHFHDYAEAGVGNDEAQFMFGLLGHVLGRASDALEPGHE